MVETNIANSQPVSDEYLEKMNAYWRAANYLGAAQLNQLGVEFRHSVEIPVLMKITDLDICRIFGNLLENAVYAVENEQDLEGAYVNCMCKVRMGKLLISIENTYHGELRRNGDVIMSIEFRIKQNEEK